MEVWLGHDMAMQTITLAACLPGDWSSERLFRGRFSGWSPPTTCGAFVTQYGQGCGSPRLLRPAAGTIRATRHHRQHIQEYPDQAKAAADGCLLHTTVKQVTTKGDCAAVSRVNDLKTGVGGRGAGRGKVMSVKATQNSKHHAREKVQGEEGEGKRQERKRSRRSRSSLSKKTKKKTKPHLERNGAAANKLVCCLRLAVFKDDLEMVVRKANHLEIGFMIHTARGG